MQCLKKIMLKVSVSVFIATSPSAFADNFFDRGFAVSTLANLEWLANPISVNFILPEFHQSAFEIRSHRIEVMIHQLERHLRIIDDHELKAELLAITSDLKFQTAEIANMNVNWTIRCLLLREPLDKARHRLMKYLVNSSEDFNFDENDHLLYSLQPEDLYGWLAGLRVLAATQIQVPPNKRKPFYLTYADLSNYWSQLRAFQRILNRWVNQTPKALAPALLTTLDQIQQSLNNPFFQQLQQMLFTLENQWFVHDATSLKIDVSSPEYHALERNIQSLMTTTQVIFQLFEEQLKHQRLRVKVADSSCADLLWPYIENAK